MQERGKFYISMMAWDDWLFIVMDTSVDEEMPDFLTLAVSAE
jgi:hypothetical protein